MFVVRLVAASPCPFAGQDRLADGTSFWSVERGRPGAEGGKNGGQGSRKEQGERPPKECKLSSRRPKRERERERKKKLTTISL